MWKYYWEGDQMTTDAEVFLFYEHKYQQGREILTERSARQYKINTYTCMYQCI
jgi:hypothetical protein